MSEVRNLKVWAALLMAALAASVLVAAVLASPAQAAPFAVTNTADSGEGSLRQAISDANASAGEDTINFDPSLSGQTITLGSQLPIADGAGLTIDSGSADITVSGNNAVRVLDVRSGAKLTLNNLTVANGRINFGGGIFNNGTLTVNNSTLSGNNANEDFGSGGGGGIWNAASGTATVSNSTLSGNSAQIAGGGIFNQGGTLTVSNSTLSGNSANNGGNLSSNGGSVTLKNTIVANNEQVRGWDCSGTITDGGYNLDSGTSCGFATENNSLSGEDPLLGALADNGGPTLTHALLEGSPAIDKAVAVEGITTDQRGVTRPQGAAPDIGAFESESTVIKDTTAPQVSAATPTGTGIGRGTNVVATFSEKMDAATINKTTFRLFKVTSSGTTQVTNVTVAPSSDGLKATLNPFGTSTSLLARNTKYRAVVTTGAEDLAGNALDQNSTRAGNQQKSWTFTTKG